jgi:anti-anti-sigma factor
MEPADRERVGRRPAADGPVLACVDDGPGGRAVAGIADSLARRLGLRVLLATVEPASPRMDLVRALGRHGRMLLTAAAIEVDHAAEMRVAFGEPAQRLIAIAQREVAELIVVAAPTASQASTLLGNVHLALAGAGPCPVVVVPPGLEMSSGDGRPIICSIDDSKPSLAAARVAARLASRLDIQVRLVRRDELSAQTSEPSVAKPRRLAERVIEVAEREGAEMIVSASRGEESFADVLLGPVSSQLIAATTRPLVIVPPGARMLAANPAFALVTRETRRGTVLFVRGEVGSTTVATLERRATRVLDETQGSLVLDLSETRSVDLHGVRLTERLARRASELGGSLVVVAAALSVKRILRLSLRSFVPVTDCLDSALEAIDRGSPARQRRS